MKGWIIMKTMSDQLKSIIKEIIDDYGLNCKRVRADNLDIAGIKMDYGTPHLVCYYGMKNIGKTIYMEYDEYRNVSRNVFVYDNDRK